ncbi:hypothetical protein [Stappia sp.]|uniref:hypothetical protein n=1 Tax=Stappia sp. TaxID=1870903 RepID=UPI003C79E3E4
MQKLVETMLASGGWQITAFARAGLPRPAHVGPLCAWSSAGQAVLMVGLRFLRYGGGQAFLARLLPWSAWCINDADFNVADEMAFDSGRNFGFVLFIVQMSISHGLMR